MKVWDTSESQAPVVSLSGHPDAVFDVSACPTNTDVLASCGRKGSFIIWDLRTTGQNLIGTEGRIIKFEKDSSIDFQHRESQP